MPQITVKDAAGTSQTVAKVVNTGSAADADSLPVAQSTEDKAVAAATNTKLDALSDKLPATLGTLEDSESLGVALSTEAKAQLGSLTETAPANDTASAGLNGRLQRIAQRMTALIARLPDSLGAKTSAASLSVVPASDAVTSVAFSPATLVTVGGSLTTGGAAQNAASANTARKGWWIQNLSSGDLWVSTIATAVQDAPSLRIIPGAYYETPPGGAGGGAISIIGATTGQKWAGREW